MGGPPAYGLDQVLETPRRKTYHVTNHSQMHGTWIDPLV